MRRARLSSCEGKEAMSERLARRTLKRLRHRSNRRLELYLCAFCGFWHIGSAPATCGERAMSSQRPESGRVWSRALQRAWDAEDGQDEP